MKIVIAIDSFKGSLSSIEACKIASQALLKYNPLLKIALKPIADGGEGTANTILTAKKGVWIPKLVTGPLPNMRVRAGYAYFKDDKTALIEMAAANGLPLLKPKQRNPLKTTTYGTGELIKAALKKNPSRIILAVGGSATVDGGVGAAIALGWKFLDSSNMQIPLGGGNLSKITKIIPPKNLQLPPIQVLCDVTNPLVGKNGAAAVFGPQKGASAEMVKILEAGLINLKKLVKKQLNKNINFKGCGAAGGLSAGAVAFFDADLVSGIETIIEITNLEKEINNADLVITGEGKFDRQSLDGKVVSGVAMLAKKYKVPVAVFAGTVELKKNIFGKYGIITAEGIKTTKMSLKYAIDNSKKLLYDCVLNFAKSKLPK